MGVFAEDKKVIFSGIQPSGIPTIGNYIGSIKNWIALQEDYNCLFSVVDLHAITVRQDPLVLRQKARDLLALYIACGIDPVKHVLYCQSHVSAHSELSWILNCFSYMGELGRMTQFKEKSAKHEENINAGLFTYPILQAADILLYQTDLVPVGEDQKQHIELCRDIATRFNNVYGDVFKVPEAYITKTGARIMSLQEPTKKMSKSETENINNVISMLDEPNVIINRFKRAMTDSGSEIKATPEKPGITNLLNIYSIMKNQTVEKSELEFQGKGYGDFKLAVGESVVSVVTPVQEEFKRIIKDKTYLDNIMKTNAERASFMASKTLKKVQKKIGFITL